jgi:hypothetical protein
VTRKLAAADLTLLAACGVRDLAGSEHSDSRPSEVRAASLLRRRRLFRENVAATDPTSAMRRLVIPRACAVTRDKFIKHLKLCAVDLVPAGLHHFISGGGGFYPFPLLLLALSHLYRVFIPSINQLFVCLATGQ